MQRTLVCSIPLVCVTLFGCGGTSAAGNQLVRFAAEPAGQRCPTGGVAILSGRDANGDGTLQDGEVDSALTQYVCNGATGQTGTTGTTGGQGLDSLVVATAEPAGSNCPFGGERLDAGIDTNNDGKLETPEITQTTFVCNRDPLLDVHVGDMFIDRADDLARFAGVRVIGGDLRVRGALGTTLSLPQLEHIAGNLVIDGDAYNNGGPVSIPGLTTVSLPNLVTVVSVFVYSQHELTTLSLPSLTTATNVLLNDLPAMTTLSMPLVSGIMTGTVSVTNAPLVTTLSMPKVTELDGLVLGNDAALSAFDLSALARIHSSMDVHATKLDRCALGRLWTSLAVRPNAASLRDNTQSTCAPADVCAQLTVTSITGAKAYQCIDSRSFADAESLCGQLGGHVLWFESAAEVSEVSGLFAHGKLAPGWLGYTDLATAGTWAPTGTSSFDPTKTQGFWASGEPKGSGQCLEFNASGTGQASACATELPSLCRAPN